MKTGLHEAAVTGPTGLIGRWLLLALTRRGLRVLALMRRSAERLEALRAWVDARGGNGALIDSAEMDLMADDLGMTDDGRAALRRAARVYHLAARFGFNLSKAEARKANVSAVETLIDVLAGGAIERLVFISGYRTEGRPALALDIDDDDALSRFYRSHGAYEASKMEAHHRVARAAAAAGVPLTRISPASVIGDSRTGETTQYIGLAEVFADLWAGRLPALPGAPDTWLPVVPVDVLAALLAEVHREPEGGHLVVLDERSPSMGELVRLGAARMGASAPSLRVPAALLRSLPRSVSGVEPEALSFISSDRYDAQPWMQAAARLGVEIPPIVPVIERWIDHLVDTRFGQAPPRGGRIYSAAGTTVYAEGRAEQAAAVLLHGLPLTGRSWAPVASLLDAPVMIPDLPGLGRSGGGGGTLAEWTRGMLAGSRRPWLIGHSLGCALAVDHAAAHPERVAGVVLVSPFFLQARAGWVQRQPWLVAPALRRLSPKALHALIGSAGEAAEDALAALRRPSVARSAARWLAWASRQDTRDRLSAQLAALEVPAVLVCGERDPLVASPPEGIEVFEIAGAGHHPQLTHPGAVAPILHHLMGPQAIASKRAMNTEPEIMERGPRHVR